MFYLLEQALYWILVVLLRRPVLARGPTILYVLTLIPTLVLYRHLTTIGRPRREPTSGALISPGEDLAQSGITEWCWDIIYVTWGCAVGSGLLGSWVWWLYLIVCRFSSIYALYQALTIYIRVLDSFLRRLQDIYQVHWPNVLQ